MDDVSDYLPWIALGLAAAWVASPRAPARSRYSGPRPKMQGVPFAAGDPAPRWPLKTSHKRGHEVAYLDVDGKTHGNGARRFMATRDNGARWHVGIDLYANAGDVVVAPESGRIVNSQNFLTTIPGDDALVIQGDRGVTYILGEIAGNSWRDYGLQVGSRVAKGQPVARVGLTSKGSHMLHFETYACCPVHNEPWYKGTPRPPHVLDPTDYLLRARGGALA